MVTDFPSELELQDRKSNKWNGFVQTVLDVQTFFFPIFRQGFLFVSITIRLTPLFIFKSHCPANFKLG